MDKRKSQPWGLTALVLVGFVAALFYIDHRYPELQTRPAPPTVKGRVELTYRSPGFGPATVVFPLPNGWEFTYNKAKPKAQGTMRDAAGKAVSYVSFFHPDSAGPCEGESPESAYLAWIIGSFPQTTTEAIAPPAGPAVLAFPEPQEPMDIFPERGDPKSRVAVTIVDLVLCYEGKLACVRFALHSKNAAGYLPALRDLAAQSEWLPPEK